MYENIYTGEYVTVRTTHVAKSNEMGSFLYPYLKLFDKHNYCIGIIPYTKLQTYYRRIK